MGPKPARDLSTGAKCGRGLGVHFGAACKGDTPDLQEDGNGKAETGAALTKVKEPLPEESDTAGLEASNFVVLRLRRIL